MTIQRFVTIGYDDCFQTLICHGSSGTKDFHPFGLSLAGINVDESNSNLPTLVERHDTP